MFDINGTVVRRFVDEVINNVNYFAIAELVHPSYEYRIPIRSWTSWESRRQKNR